MQQGSAPTIVTPTVERPVKSVEVANPVAETLQPTLAPAERQEVAPKPTEQAGGTQVEQTTAVRASVTRRRAAGSGLSIASMISGEPSETESGEEKVVVADVKYDPASEEKILAVRDAVVAGILEERPRFVVAFEQMRVEGHTIKVEVPSQTLYEEIVRSQTELLLIVSRIAGVNGSLDLEVTINEQIKASRPIKLEDRVKFLMEKNPHLLELKRVLDMEYE